MPSFMPAIWLLAVVAAAAPIFFMFSDEPALKTHQEMGYLGLLCLFVAIELWGLRQRIARLEEKRRESK